MAKSNDSLADWNKLGFVEIDGKLVKADAIKAYQEKQNKSVSDWFATHPELNTPREIRQGNKKVKNAVKVEQDGIKFDSRLEQYAYNAFKAAGINFEFQVVYLLQEKFRYGTEAIRPITSRIDFFIPLRTLFVDTKGYANDVAPLKYKLLKKVLYDQFNAGLHPILPRIEMPKNKKEVDVLVNRILYEF